MKTYLGDGVYAVLDRTEVVLTTENGIEATNTIFLDYDTLDSFIDFLKMNGLLTAKIVYSRTDPK